MIINKNKSGIIDIQKRHDRFKKIFEELDEIKTQVFKNHICNFDNIDVNSDFGYFIHFSCNPTKKCQVISRKI